MELMTPVEEDVLLRDACFTEVQWRSLMAWGAAKGDDVYDLLDRARTLARFGVSV